MDFFGIGAAIRGAALVYLNSARRTGRTTTMLERTRDGDVLVFATREHARTVEQLLKERGINAKCCVVPPDDRSRLPDKVGGTSGRVIFDHVWCERYYLDAIECAAREIHAMEETFSRRPAVGGDTMLKHQTIDRWERPL